MSSDSTRHRKRSNRTRPKLPGTEVVQAGIPLVSDMYAILYISMKTLSHFPIYFIGSRFGEPAERYQVEAPAATGSVRQFELKE